MCRGALPRVPRGPLTARRQRKWLRRLLARRTDGGQAPVCAGNVGAGWSCGNGRAVEFARECRGKFLCRHGFATHRGNAPTHAAVRAAGMTTAVAPDIIRRITLTMIDSRLRRFLTVLFPALLCRCNFCCSAPIRSTPAMRRNSARRSGAFWCTWLHRLWPSPPRSR